jgi:RND family efflux transporter MFP subunit
MRRPGLLLGCLLATVPTLGCSSDSPATASPPKAAGARESTPRDVRVVPVAEVRVPQVVAVTGTLVAEEQVLLSLKVTGRLAELAVDLGSVVRRGQVVARLDPTDFRLRLEQAEAALHQARARLGLDPAGTDGQVDPEQTSLVLQARAVLEEARLTRERVAEGRYQDAREEVRNRQAILAQRGSELELARQALADTVLRAPADGMIRERRAAVGEYLAAGAPVATLVKVHPLRLVLAVPERAAAAIRVGQDVRVSVEGDAAVHAGRVARLSPSIHEQSRTLTVEAEVPNPEGRLRPGAFARAEVIVAADQPALFVPASAIVIFAGIEKVLTVREGRAVELRVQTGRRQGERVEIVAGLRPGEPVVVEPGNLVGGQPVTVQP